MRWSSVVPSLVAVVLAVSGCSKHELPVAESAASGSSPAQASSHVRPDHIEVGGFCALDAVDGSPPAGIPLKGNDAIVFAGWFGDANGQVPESALLVLTGDAGEFEFTVRAGGHRPDVPLALGMPGLENSGYHSLLSMKGVTPGSYRTSIVMQGGASVECPLNAEIVIGE